ncbi:MAG: methylated-DNA--[protein]-cysteine S-methyltransferase, partial [Actinomycetota bacterium]|nr:methylated-DNA--[protein]-cysteine S-methyltransferase [Actinomycetota bacterium]
MLAPATTQQFLRRMESPLGRILLTGDGKAVTALVIERHGVLPLEEAPERGGDVLEAAVAQLREYFDGGRHSFDVPVVTRGTEFQQAVWRYLST